MKLWIILLAVTISAEETENQDRCLNLLPGIPGSPGHNGFPGRDGRDGEKGGKGDKGEPGHPGGPGKDGVNGGKGEPGVDGRVEEKGSKGDKGERGWPGKIGPFGDPGPMGEIGQTGLKGEIGPIGPPGSKGEIGAQGVKGLPGNQGTKGEKGKPASTPRSAFCVGLTETSRYPPVNEPIKFEKVLYNGLNHYDPATGKFTCPISGVYYFTYHITVYSKNVKVRLMKNGSTMLHTNDVFKEVEDQAAGGIILELQIGDQVWLQTDGTSNGLYADRNDDTTFTGFLLYST